jgi:hemerythrin-like domain-containing protein
MARAKQSSTEKPLALELLASDHRKVEDLFERYESAKEDEDEGRTEIAERICKELTVHAQVEEELFYPWLKENLDEEDMEMVEEAYVEHASAKDLIAQIEGAGGPDGEYDAKVKVLSEYIKHHVKEEENEIFEACADMQEELDELGQEIASRKAELAEEHGLTEDEAGTAAMAGKRGESGRAAQRSRG